NSTVAVPGGVVVVYVPEAGPSGSYSSPPPASSPGSTGVNTVATVVPPATQVLPPPTVNLAPLAILNGDFSISNPAAAGFGWSSTGTSGVSSGHLVVSEDSTHH